MNSKRKLGFKSKNLAKKSPEIFHVKGFKKSMRPETRKSMEMLFTAKWNLPKAAKHANLTNKEMKITFNEYCAFHAPTWDSDGSVAE